MQAKGESNQSQHYAFLDEETPVQTTYYRLRMVDRDGSVAYSKIVSVAADKSLLLVTILGNPTHDRIQAVVNSPPAQSLQISLQTIAGRELRRQVVTVNQGQTSVEVDAANLAAGVYQLIVFDGTSRHVKRILIN